VEVEELPPSPLGCVGLGRSHDDRGLDEEWVSHLLPALCHGAGNATATRRRPHYESRQVVDAPSGQAERRRRWIPAREEEVAARPAKSRAASGSVACCSTATAKRPDLLCFLMPGVMSRQCMRCLQVTIHIVASKRRTGHRAQLPNGPGFPLPRYRPRFLPFPGSNRPKAAQLQDVRVSLPHRTVTTNAHQPKVAIPTQETVESAHCSERTRSSVG
jgi:hypothetical protein